MNDVVRLNDLLSRFVKDGATLRSYVIVDKRTIRFKRPVTRSMFH